MNECSIKWSKPQLDFITSTTEVTAYCGGFGSGKTYSNINLAIQNRLRVPNPKYSVAFYEPSHSLLETVAYPTLIEILPKYGLIIGKNCSFVGNPKVLLIYGFGDIRFNSLTDPSKIMGSNNVSIHVDETDRICEVVMTKAFKQMYGRLREANEDKKYFKDMCRIAFTSTPEGLKFLYKHFDTSVIGDKYNGERRLIKANIMSNPFIDRAGFIKKLDHLTPEMKRAYIDGDFINMDVGAVYNHFSESRNVIDTIYPGNNYLIYVGVDFNIQHSSAVFAFESDDGSLIIYDEFDDAYDTFEMSSRIKQMTQGSEHLVTIHPDASGRNRHTSSIHSNIDVLNEEGFNTEYDSAGNPPIRSSVNLCNIKLYAGDIKICRNCVKLIAALKQQTNDKHGLPDKTSGVDHLLDAFRYNVYYRMGGNNSVISGYRSSNYT